MNSEKPGIAGYTARLFQSSQLTPLLAIIGLLMGVFAVLVTPKEEEPQIDVTFANVFIPFPGASAVEVEHLVATPAEQIISELNGIKHIYSISRPGMAALTVQFEVGVPRNDVIVRLYNKIYSNADWLPANLGVGQPLIKPRGIDDVPIVSVTLWSENRMVGAHELAQVAHTLEVDLKRIKGTRDIYTVGAPDSVARVILDPAKMAGYHIDIDALRNALMATNTSSEQFSVLSNRQEIYVQAGEFLTQTDDLKNLVVGVSEGRTVLLGDVAQIQRGPDLPRQYVSMGLQGKDLQPAVTLAVAKQPGENATQISQSVIDRLEALKGIAIPEGVEVEITRNYGKTAADKATKLIIELFSATLSVVLLLWLTLGRRQALIVGTGVIITLTITLFASWVYGFTINRVSLFALIFSIGILVDDAIVVVENIHRHVVRGGRPLSEIIPLAVNEVGGPTILATFTVIAALMPMAFVSGLMGPYMGPVPINASMGMVISNIIAFVVIPWMALRLFKKEKVERSDSDGNEPKDRLEPLFRRILTPFLQKEKGRSRRYFLLTGVLLLIVGAVMLPVYKLVVLKMLPFDNKSEFQVIVDMPEGTPLEQTHRVLGELGKYLMTVPEIRNIQLYAGTAAPINFNGLVRQYYLREGANVGDIQVNLKEKSERDRQSHDIALSVRAPLQEIGRRYKANVKIVEVPPGPPVQAPVVAEIYGVDYSVQLETARLVREKFSSTPDIVDVDDSIEAPARKWSFRVDRERAARLGVSQQSIVSTISAALKGEDISYLHEPMNKYPVPVRIELSDSDRAEPEKVLALKVRSRNGHMLPLSEMVTVVESALEKTIYHKDMLPVVFVTADMAGDLDSPLYGMFEISSSISDTVRQGFISAPRIADSNHLKWDGEWQITYETFRDMGIAYAVGVIFIYLFVVAEFRSYFVPLIIMVPIPLTIIGVLPGHMIMGEQFTATSMIGMIALAGIIVRNSILLVDFINESARSGLSFQEAVIKSGAVRAKPILLTGFSTMVGAFFMLGDPIFSGLAVSLISGILVSTLLTLVVIPVMFYAFNYRLVES